MSIENVIKAPVEKEHRNYEVVRYMIQRRLLIESSDTKEEILSRKFISTLEKLRETVRNFAGNAKLIKSQMLRQHMQLSNSLISRIYSNSLDDHSVSCENTNMGIILT
jgi:hypothetical protein